jgi:NAD(P) transhydrogenase
MANETKTYDLVIIGGGPAGIIAARSAGNFHKSVALVDCHKELGGAGVNTGTVPSKTLRETALALSGLKSRQLYGVDLSLRREVTIADFLGHEQHVRAGFNALISQQLVAGKTEIFYGQGTMTDPHTVSVRLHPAEGRTEGEEVLLRGEKILIGTGSSPVRPAMFPFGDTEIYDSDTVLNLDRIPKTLAVIGAGVIGAEYACTFAALGAETHIIDGRDVLLPFLDAEISKALVAALESQGITLHWKEKVVECAAEAKGAVTLKLSSGATMTVDAVLVAAGRKSNTENLGLDKAGVVTGERGLIPVNADYQTNVAHIYAAGDVIGFPSLASTSMEQARRAIRHAFGLPAALLSPLLPNGIYTIPEVSMVGETEESLKKKGIEYVVGRATFRENARGQIIGDQNGFLKLIFGKKDYKLIGVHVIGELATEIVHIGLMAMMTEQSYEIFVEACFNTPTLSQLYKAASLDAIRNSGVVA